MEKVSKLRLVVEPSADKFDGLTEALKRLGEALDELRATGTLDVTIDMNVKNKTGKDAA